MAEINWKTQEEIETEQNQLNKVDELEKAQIDLTFQLMTLGVI
jgi:hypothetical protein